MAEAVPAASVRAERQTPAPPDNVSKWGVFLHALFFVLGFTLVFTLLGVVASMLGQSLNAYLDLVQKLGALMLVIFALTTLGFFRWLTGFVRARVDLAKNPAAEALVSILEVPGQLLYTEKRVAGMHDINRGWGYLSSAVVGISFAAGWVPCIGPILASILLLAGDTQTVGRGAGLLLIYSLGLGIPFLLTGAMFSSMSRWLRKLNRHMGIISIISGLFMLYVAFLLWNGSLATLTTQFSYLNDLVFRAEDWVSGVSGSGGSVIDTGLLTAVLLAFTGGIISFFSPCVLPLVPAYIGFLSGAAVGARPKE